MPQIIITTDEPGDRGTEVHRERINTADVETDTASHLLVERIGWAVSDAHELEDGGDATAGFSRHSGSIADTAVH